MMSLLITAGLAMTAAAAAVIANRINAGFRDPRFRNPNWLTRQASEEEICVPRDIQRITGVRELGTRRLRLTLSPGFTARSWRIFRDGRETGESRHPDITFPEEADGLGPQVGNTFRLEPQNGNASTIQLRIFFYPRTRYLAAGLSWPNAYILKETNTRIGFHGCPGYTVADWVGLHPKDPGLGLARSAMEGEVDFAAPLLKRQEAVFRFMLRQINHLTDLPDDALLNATPWGTWEGMRNGHEGFCECKSLIYYLFANAAGIPTRLVDLQGSVGNLVLTGHYVCESWLADERSWVMVDPHKRNIARVYDPDGKPLHTIALKKRYDLNHLEGCTIRQYNAENDTMVTRPLADLASLSMEWIRGPLVIGYKFGYPRNHRHRRLRTFFFRPTLLYSTLALPQPRRALPWTLAAMAAGLFLILMGFLLIA